MKKKIKALEGKTLADYRNPIDPKIYGAIQDAYFQQIDGMSIPNKAKPIGLDYSNLQYATPTEEFGNTNIDASEKQQSNNTNWGMLAALGLTGINALIPGEKINRPVVQPGLSYNEHPYGTGSQAIMKEGGDLSASKAKEMLRDGTANGKKLTKKQKQYFGMVAAGKAEAGLSTGEPVISPGADNVKLSELISYNIINGGMPLNNKDGRSLYNRARSVYGDGQAQSLLTDLTLFNQDRSNMHLSKEDRIRRYYEMQSSNPQLNELKKSINSYGYGPVDIYNTTNNIDALQQQGKGLLAQKMKSGGTINAMSYNPYDGGTKHFKGKSHAEGGIDITANGMNVEVEGGETAIQGLDGTVSIMGNMRVPGTNSKFKSVSKELAKKENEYTQLVAKGEELLSTTNPERDKLKYTTATLLKQGGTMGQKDIVGKKKLLVDIQNMMLGTANSLGLDPIALSEGKKKKAKYGGTFAAGGDPKPSVAKRHNNPGNIKYTTFSKKFGAVQGDPATDGGYFAKFPDTTQGLNALKALLDTDGYRNLTVEKAVKRWTGGSGYAQDLGDLKGKTVKDLNTSDFNNLVNQITYGEDGKYYDGTEATAKDPTTKTNLDPVDFTQTMYKQPKYDFNPKVDGQPTPNYRNPDELGTINPVQDKSLPSNARGLSPLEILPELYAIANNKEEPVRLQSYTPDLFSPYQISLQDRRNNNTDTFNSIQRVTQDNPAALGTFAAQKYNADNQVNAEEFRINQGISNDVTNKNVGLLNDAKLKNLALADGQADKQAQARANTKAYNQVILNSISSKFLQNNAQNQKLALYENLYDYRFTDKNKDGLAGEAEYMGPDAHFSFPGTGTGTQTTDSQKIVEYDANGNVKKTRIRYASPLQTEGKQLDNQKKKYTLPLLRSFNLGR